MFHVTSHLEGESYFPLLVKPEKFLELTKTVALKSDVLIINGQRHTVVTLNKLKGQLDIKNFIERSNENCVVFECSVYEKLQATRAKVAPVNLIYGSHFSATEATYKVSQYMGNL